MVPTMLKRLGGCVVLTVWMLGVVGCVKQSEYDAKVTEVKSQANKLAKLQKDLDAAKSEIEKAAQAKKDAEAENGDLKGRVKKLSQAEEKLSQLQKDFESRDD